MRINNINTSQLDTTITEKASGPSGSSFADAMKKAVSDVNDLQSSADTTANKIASGEPVEIHQAVIDMQKAVNAFQLTVQVRNKIIEAYQEIMRMQV